VVESGRTGLLVPPADAVALGDALARVVRDAALRQRMGRDARASVLPRFGVDRYVASVVALYDQLLKKAA
jgi:glycosyltransferase involved in cell wall biosynthesis